MHGLIWRVFEWNMPGLRTRMFLMESAWAKKEGVLNGICLIEEGGYYDWNMHGLRTRMF